MCARALALFLTGFVSGASAAIAGTETRPSPWINFNFVLTEADFAAGCTAGAFIDQGTCSDLASTPVPGQAFLWVVVSGSGGFDGGGGFDGISAAQFGIEHDLSIAQWVGCTNGPEIPSATWPESGSGNAVTWASCYQPTGANARIGYFVLNDGITGSARITPHPVDARLLITDCAARTHAACPLDAGAATLALGTEPNCSSQTPVPTAPEGVTTTIEGCAVRASWTHDGENLWGFDVIRDGVVIGESAASERDYLDTTVPSQRGSFDYAVVAKTDCGANAVSAPVTAFVPPIPAASGCSASDGLCGRTEIVWVDNSDDETGFRVRRSGSVIAALGAGVTSYIDTTSPPNQIRMYDVVVVGPCGPGMPSNADDGVLVTDPSAPTNLTATIGQCQRVRLAWEDASANEAAFRVFRDGTQIASLPPDSDSYDDTGVSVGVDHLYTVAAFNDCATAHSTPVSGSAADELPVSPSGLIATDDLCGEVQLTWTNESADEDGFRILRDGLEIGTVGPEAVRFEDTDVPPATSYLYEVTAFNSCGESGPSNSDAGSRIGEQDPAGVIQLVSPPTGADCLGQPISFAWRSDPAASIYELELLIDCSAPMRLEVTSDTTAALDTGDGPLTWRVRGQNRCNEWGPWSECRPFEGAPTLSAPEHLQISGEWDQEYEFWWDVVPDATGYEVAVHLDDERGDGCHVYDADARIYPMSGPPLTLHASEIGNTFISWVAATTCGARGALSECEYPQLSIPVVLEYFRALPSPGTVTIEWATRSESGITAFAIERERAGHLPVRVTGTPITSGEGVYRHDDVHVEPGAAYTYMLVEIGDDGTEAVLARTNTSVPPIAERLALSARPNPFNPRVTLTLEFPSSAHARVDVLDAAGRIVATLVDSRLEAGVHHEIWNGRDALGREVASGLYFARVRTGAERAVRRLTLLR